MASNAVTGIVGRAVDEPFLDLVCSDEDLLRAEFDAIVTAEWPTPPAGDPARGGVAVQRPPAGGARGGITGGVRPPATLDHPGVDGWVRPRSPPDAGTE